MKTIRWLCWAAVILAGCARTAEVPKLAEEHVATTTLLSAAQYEFELVSVKPDPNQDAMGVFRFIHRAKDPIRLWGFWFVDEKGKPTKESNAFRVRFEEFKREEGGKWAAVPVGYCGTGAEMFPIQPNREYTFLVPLWPFVEKGTRGIVRLSGEGITVESKPFETGEIRKAARGQ